MTVDLLSMVPMTLRCRIADLRGRGVYSEFADDFRTIFIHVPKSAGTSISRTLFNRESRHVPWQEYYRANPGKVSSVFQICVRS